MNSPGIEPVRHWLKRMLLAVSVSSVLSAGCGYNRTMVHPRQPIVASRFSPPAGFRQPDTLKLHVQNGGPPVQSLYTDRIATAVATEIELVQPGLRVQQWSPASTSPIQPDVDHFAPLPWPSALSVRYQPETSVYPPHDQLTVPGRQNPSSSEALQIHVVEFRPWLPMRAAIQLTVVDADTMEPTASTTAEWTVVDGTVCGGCRPTAALGKRQGRQARRQAEVVCQPDGGHNSPEAFIQVIAQQIAEWHAMQSLPPVDSIDYSLAAP